MSEACGAVRPRVVAYLRSGHFPSIEQDAE